ncbi:MAG: hypothetical protein GC160_24220 [Acidobacteria bacterium]|nr:hypothetical protein [Acidobacteriota bacterium]
MLQKTLLAGLLAPFLLAAQTAPTERSVPVDLSAYEPGLVRLTASEGSLEAQWPDEAGVDWTARFSLDPKRPLLTSIRADGQELLSDGRPWFRVETGKRRRGWNAFFDNPPTHPDGTRVGLGDFSLRAAKAVTVGNRLELHFDGLKLGLFDGAVVYTFYPGGRLFQQEARVRTYEADVAYYYDTGLTFAAPGDETVGRNMDSDFVWYDTAGEIVRHHENGFQPERIPEKVRHRTLAARTGAGSLAVFPAPHQYFFPRDFTSNLSYLWHQAWRGRIGLGIRQIADTGWQFYPWMNAPPGTEQHLRLFLQLSTQGPEAALEDVLAYTHGDRFPALDGYKTLSSHWHLAYTIQALEQGPDWTPPFKQSLETLGVDASIIMDFHGDGHPRDLTDLRLRELDAFFRACRSQSDDEFLLIPSEEANVHFGGHWAMVFPKPVYWFMDRPEGGAFETTHPQYGKVYSAANAEELLELARRERGWMYQTHARTKGSTGYPDKIKDEPWFRDDAWFGAGFKALPSDPSSPRLGDRVFQLLDDMQSWGLHKKALGEVDVFQNDTTHELYAHMNINYVRADRLPDFDHYDQILQPLLDNEFFVTTGEVLLPEVEIGVGDPNTVRVKAEVRWTLPLTFAEIVWGSGDEVHRETIPLTATKAHGQERFEWSVPAPSWDWARVAVWDVAADGAYVNPIWRKAQ